MNKYIEITKINYGFLSDDLVFSDDGLWGLDKQASCEKYQDLCMEALTAAYPNVEITIDYQMDASGCKPYPLQTRVEFSDGGANDEETDMTGDVDNVEQICANVYETYEWAVEDSNIINHDSELALYPPTGD